MTPLFHPAAEQEVAAALKVGEERGSGLGRELIQRNSTRYRFALRITKNWRATRFTASTLSPAQVSIWTYLSH